MLRRPRQRLLALGAGGAVRMCSSSALPIDARSMGLHRVRAALRPDEPVGSGQVVRLPQGAWSLDNTIPSRDGGVLDDTETVLNVTHLELDSTSMKQIRAAVVSDGGRGAEPPHVAIGREIMRIVGERGKMHNPVTNSGGVLVGAVARMSARVPGSPGARRSCRCAA